MELESLEKEENRREPTSLLPPMAEGPVYLGDHRLLVRTRWGGRLVVPSYNVDVAIGAARDGVIEPWTTRLVQELVREGNVVINAGANFGYYTVLSAHIVGVGGRVIAIEANPHIVPYLISSCFWSGVPDRVTIYNCAAWHVNGQILNFFFSPAFLGGGSAKELTHAFPAVEQRTGPVVEMVEDALWDSKFIRTSTDESCRVRFDNARFIPLVQFQIETRTIDDICSDVQRAHLLHMDIEGAEALAMMGAKRLIERSPDIRVIFEWSSSRYKYGTAEARKGFDEIWQWLTEQGFRIRELYPRVAEDGAIFVSDPLGFEYLAHQAASGDFVATRPHSDPWDDRQPKVVQQPSPLTDASGSYLPAELADQITDSQKSLRGWCRDEKAIWLASLVLDNRIRTAVEIGVCGGRSLLPVAWAMKHLGKGVIYGVEPWSGDVGGNDPVAREWWENVDHATLKREFLEYICKNNLTAFVRIIETESDLARLMFSASPHKRSIGLLHIDGAHDEEQALRDVMSWTDIVADGGCVVLDDITWASVQKAKSWMDERFETIDERLFPETGEGFKTYRIVRAEEQQV